MNYGPIFIIPLTILLCCGNLFGYTRSSDLDLAPPPFQYMFSETGGMLPILKELYHKKRYQVITTEIFKNFLEEQTGMNPTGVFRRYVYGQGTKSGSNFVSENYYRSKHPSIRPYTKEELREYH